MNGKMKFLYKPAFFGESKLEKELDFYARERQEELRRAGLIDAYENFWNARTVIKTNIYGAIPVSELNEKQEQTLRHYGWRNAEVDLCAVLDGDSFDEQLKEEDGKYIVLREPEDDALTVLQFHFDSIWKDVLA